MIRPKGPETGTPPEKPLQPDGPSFSDQQILAARGGKNPVDPLQPYLAFVEPEFSADGLVEDVATIFLSNRECPLRCLMCDLWKNTTPDRVPDGGITQQIRFALESLPTAPRIKLYNSGNFFDAQAIPRVDLPGIAELLGGFKSVVIENHPKLCGQSCLDFQQACQTQVEVAMGLETSHAPTLKRLNKQMTIDDFSKAADFLKRNNMRVRAFILLRPPWTSESQGIERAIESVRFAFESGVDCCAVIPTRAGNGIMDQLQQLGSFQPPQLSSLETVLSETLAWNQGLVFADLWEAEQFADCNACAQLRISRLQEMNLTQTIMPPVHCTACRIDGGNQNA